MENLHGIVKTFTIVNTNSDRGCCVKNGNMRPRENFKACLLYNLSTLTCWLKVSPTCCLGMTKSQSSGIFTGLRTFISWQVKLPHETFLDIYSIHVREKMLFYFLLFYSKIPRPFYRAFIPSVGPWQETERTLVTNVNSLAGANPSLMSKWINGWNMIVSSIDPGWTHI